MQIMYTASDTVHGAVQSLPNPRQFSVDRFLLMDCQQRSRLKQSAGECVPYIVMDLSCDPVAFRKLSCNQLSVPGLMRTPVV